MKIISTLKRNPLATSAELQKLPELPTVSKSDKLLLVIPHPDDEVLGSGGLLQRFTAIGADVRILLVTSGNKWGKQALRRAEVKRAVAVCGVPAKKIIFSELNDGLLHREQFHIKKQLQAVLQQFKPTMVVTSDPADLHRDHSVLAKVVKQVFTKYLPNVPVYGALIHYHRFPGRRPGYTLRPPKRFLKDSQWFTLWLTDVEQNLKSLAIKQYKSQLAVPLLRALMFSFNRRNEIYRLL